MRQNANNRRSRGRGGRKSGNPRNQTFDSNGPGARVRGNASQIYEKYQQLARDASSSGDRIASENYLQHAEHYFRLMNANNQRAEQRNGADDSQRDSSDDNDSDQDTDNEAVAADDSSANEDGKKKRNGAKPNARKRRPRKADEESDNSSDEDAPAAKGSKSREPVEAASA